MKRLATLVAVLAVMSVSSAVFADGASFTDPAGYTGDSRDKAELNASGYCTVLITKIETEGDGQIVYVDEADSTFTAAEEFLLKANPAVGKYKVLLGAQSGSPKETYFYVGADSDNSGDLYMKRLQNEEQNDDDSSYNIGYYATVTASQYGQYNYLKVGCIHNGSLVYGSIPLKPGWDDDGSQYSGSGDINLIFQLNNVGADYVDSAAVYLSTTDGSSSPQGG